MSVDYLRIGADPDRTINQMIPAARSGKKNLLEGSKAGRASKETELKLTNVGRASLEELLDDYLDFLRARGHEVIFAGEAPDTNPRSRMGIARDAGFTFRSSRKFFRNPVPLSEYAEF